MRSANKLLLTAAVCLLTVYAGALPVHAVPAVQPASGGITVAPAALQLGLLKGQTATTASFTIHNGYQSAVQLHFAIEQPVAAQPGTTGSAQPHLSLDSPSLTIEAGSTQAQTITFTDSATLQPGSQQMDLVIAQQGSADTGVGVLPAMRLPVTTIKYDGAVTSLGLTDIASPRFAMTLPRTVDVRLHNTGNMVAIPRGTVHIVTPDGTVVAKGTLNDQSKAIVPGASLQFSTPLTMQENARVPGNYRVVVAYGLGGDSALHSSSATFIYITWWHIAVLLGAATLGWGLYQYGRHIHRRRKTSQKPRPKRQLLIGRDI